MTSDDLPMLVACSSSRGVGGLSVGYVARLARIARSASRTTEPDRLPRPSVLAVSLPDMRQLYARGAEDAGAIAAAAVVRLGEADAMPLGWHQSIRRARSRKAAGRSGSVLRVTSVLLSQCVARSLPRLA
jgi:hypothetical protein